MLVEFMLVLHLLMPDKAMEVWVELPTNNCASTLKEARRMFTWAGITIQSANCWRST